MNDRWQIIIKAIDSIGAAYKWSGTAYRSGSTVTIHRDGNCPQKLRSRLTSEAEQYDREMAYLEER